jgi:hypothetical protein
MILPLSFPDCAFNATSSTQGGFTIASRFTYRRILLDCLFSVI